MVKNTQTLKDFYGRVLGYIETDERNVSTVKDFYRRVLGYYYPDQDVTKDFYGRVVGRGNLLTFLLNDPSRK